MVTTRYKALTAMHSKVAMGGKRPSRSTLGGNGACVQHCIGICVWVGGCFRALFPPLDGWARVAPTQETPHRHGARVAVA
eukprot:643129-Amphidinium_carterae.1